MFKVSYNKQLDRNKEVKLALRELNKNVFDKELERINDILNLKSIKDIILSKSTTKNDINKKNNININNENDDIIKEDKDSSDRILKNNKDSKKKYNKRYDESDNESEKEDKEEKEEKEVDDASNKLKEKTDKKNHQENDIDNINNDKKEAKEGIEAVDNNSCNSEADDEESESEEDFELNFNEESWQSLREAKWILKKNHLELFKNKLANFPASNLIKNKKLLITQIEALKYFLNDSNINVSKLSLLGIQSLVIKLGPHLYNKNTLFIAVLERFKEKNSKITKEIVNTLLLFQQHCKFSLKEIVDCFNSLIKENKSLASSSLFKVNFLDFCFLALGRTYINVIKKHSKYIFETFLRLSIEEASPEVKHNAVNCLCLLKLRVKKARNKEMIKLLEFDNTNEIINILNSNNANNNTNTGNNKNLSNNITMLKNKVMEMSGSDMIGYDALYDVEQIEEEYFVENNSNIEENKKSNIIKKKSSVYKEEDNNEDSKEEELNKELNRLNANKLKEMKEKEGEIDRETIKKTITNNIKVDNNKDDDGIFNDNDATEQDTIIKLKKNEKNINKENKKNKEDYYDDMLIETKISNKDQNNNISNDIKDDISKEIVNLGTKSTAFDEIPIKSAKANIYEMSEYPDENFIQKNIEIKKKRAIKKEIKQEEVIDENINSIKNKDNIESNETNNFKENLEIENDGFVVTKKKSSNFRKTFKPNFNKNFNNKNNDFDVEILVKEKPSSTNKEDIEIEEIAETEKIGYKDNKDNKENKDLVKTNNPSNNLNEEINKSNIGNSNTQIKNKLNKILKEDIPIPSSQEKISDSIIVENEVDIQPIPTSSTTAPKLSVEEQKKKELEEFERRLQEQLKAAEQQEQAPTSTPTVIKKKPKEEIENQFELHYQEIPLFNSNKWEDRKEAFSSLKAIIEEDKFAKFSPDQFFYLIRLKLKDFKELNFNVIKEALDTFTILFKSLDETTKKNFEKKNISLIVKGFIEKLNDNKVNTNLKELLYEIMENYSTKEVLSIILSYLNPDSNPSSNKKKVSNQLLIAGASFFEQIIEDYGPKMIPSKELVDYSIFLAGNTNADVRTSATGIIKVLYKYFGEDIKTLISKIKSSTLKIIEAELENVTVVLNPKNPKAVKNNIKSNSNQTPTKSANQNIEKQPVSLDSGLIPRSDISKKITPKLIKDLSDGKWPEKKDAAEQLEKILEAHHNKIHSTGLNDLFLLFKNKLNDGNKIYVKLLVSLITKFIHALGANYKSFVKTIGEKLISNLGDKTASVREEVNLCLDAWAEHLSPETIFPYIIDRLKTENFESRTEILKFINKYKEIAFNSGKVNVNDLVVPLISCLLDKTVSVRQSAEEIVAYSSKFIGVNPFIVQAKEQKQAVFNGLYPIFEKYIEQNSSIKNEDGEDEKQADTENINDNNTDIIPNNNYESHNTNVNESNYYSNINNSTSLNNINTSTTMTTNKNNSSGVKAKQTINKLGNKSNINVVTNLNNQYNSNNIDDKMKKHSQSKSPIKLNSNNINSTINNINSISNINNINNPDLLNTPIPNLNPTIFAQQVFIKNLKEKRLEYDRKFKYSAENINLNTNDEFYFKIIETLRSVFHFDFLESKLLIEDSKIISEGLEAIRDSFNKNSLSVIFDIFDVFLKFLTVKSLFFNQNPCFNNGMLEFLDDFYDNMHNYLSENELILNDSEAHTLVFLMLEKIAIPKFKEQAKIILDKYTSLIKPNRMFTLLLSFYSGKSGKMKIEILELCTSIVISDTLVLDALVSKEVKLLVKIFISNLDALTKTAVFSLLFETYLRMGDSFWGVCSGVPERVKEGLYSQFQECLVHKNNISSVSNTNSTAGITMNSSRNNNSHNSSFLLNNVAQVNQNNNVTSNVNENMNNTINKSSKIGGKVNTRNNVVSKSRLGVSNTNKTVLSNNTKTNNSMNNNKLNQPNQLNRNIIKTSTSKTVLLNNKQTNNNSQEQDNDIITNSDDLILILASLTEGVISERINQILIIHELVYTKFKYYKELLIPNVNEIIFYFCQTLNSIFSSESCLTGEINIKFGKYLLTVLYKIASNKDLIMNISSEYLFMLSEEVLTNLLIEDLEKLGENQEGLIIIRSLNSTMLRILENCDHSDVICVLLELVSKYRTSQEKGKISTLAIKCLLKLNNILKTIIEKLHLPNIIKTITELLVNFDKTNPDLISTNQSEQMIIRYVKNLFSEIVKLKGVGVIEEYNTAATENMDLFFQDKFIRKWIKNILTSMNIMIEENVFVNYNSSTDNKVKEIKTSSNINNNTTNTGKKSIIQDNSSNNALVEYPFIDEIIQEFISTNQLNLKKLNDLYKSLFVNNLEFNTLEIYFTMKTSIPLYNKLLNNWNVYKMQNISNLDKVNENPLTLNELFAKITNNTNSYTNQSSNEEVR